MQIRTGKIGLRAFLFERQVPDLATLLYRYSEVPETTVYLVLDCPDLNNSQEVLLQLQQPRALRTYCDFIEATVHP